MIGAVFCIARLLMPEVVPDYACWESATSVMKMFMPSNLATYPLFWLHAHILSVPGIVAIVIVIVLVLVTVIVIVIVIAIVIIIVIVIVIQIIVIVIVIAIVIAIVIVIVIVIEIVTIARLSMFWVIETACPALPAVGLREVVLRMADLRLRPPGEHPPMHGKPVHDLFPCGFLLFTTEPPVSV